MFYIYYILKKRAKLRVWGTISIKKWFTEIRRLNRLSPKQKRTAQGQFF
jgi:hypothetical protein